MNADTTAAARTAIERTVAAIRPGTVASYGEVARRAGLPRRARLVGRVLREAPESVPLPWHRVLRADRRLAFPEGSDAYVEQQRRLAAEGVELVGGRVPERYFNVDDDLDAALWGPE